MSLDRRHLEAVQRILEAVATVVSDTPMAALACEDAYVALCLGHGFGLSPMQVATQSDQAMAEAFASEERMQ